MLMIVYDDCRNNCDDNEDGENFHDDDDDDHDDDTDDYITFTRYTYACLAYLYKLILPSANIW